METHWIVTLTAIIPFWLLQNVIHELSHGFTIKLGWKWKFSIYPFPSTKIGRFTWAHITYERIPESIDPSKERWGLIHIMPKLVNIVFVLIASTLALAIPNDTASMLLLVFSWANLIDFGTGVVALLRSPTKKSDLVKFGECFEIPQVNLKISSIGLWIILSIPTVMSTATQFIS